METSRTRLFGSTVLTTALTLSLVASPAWKSPDRLPPEQQTSWNQPVEPFRIGPGLYYVGAAEVAAYLLTSSEGHILIDAGLPETAWVVAGNIERLGFALDDVEILLNSHAHIDHAGGLAALKKQTGARLFAMAQDVELLQDGRWFPAVQVDRTLRDLDTVRLGELELTAHLTPGHTAGCTTWTVELTDGSDSWKTVIVGGAEPLPHHDLGFGSATQDDFIETFTRLRSLRVDIFLAAHGSHFDLSRKRSRLGSDAPEKIFTDPEGYENFLDREERLFLMKVDAQRDSAGEVNV